MGTRLLLLFSKLTWSHARILLVLLLISGGVTEIIYSLTSPSVALLPPHLMGGWIRPNCAVDLYMKSTLSSSASFRKRFTLVNPVQNAAVDVTAFKHVSAWLDGVTVPLAAPSSWKKSVHFKLSNLSAGEHELRLLVENTVGPPLFHIDSTLPVLSETQGWESTLDEASWLPALRADEGRNPAIRASFPTVADGFRSSRWILLFLFFAGLFIAIICKPFASLASPHLLKLMLGFLVTGLGINNMVHISVFQGFDGAGHMDYITFILQNGRLPLASEGSQMFQSPLYYLIAAALLAFANLFVSPLTSQLILSLIPLACLLALIEISYRLLKELFPERVDLQCCGLLAGSLLPMNLYLCQYVGNEPLAALLTALLLLMLVKAFKTEKPLRIRHSLLLGLVAGLAILAKVTPCLLFPLICVLIFVVPRREKFSLAFRLYWAGAFLLAAILIAGWFFARNWLVFGKPFVGGWDPTRHIVWWQEPGYRLLGDYFCFGAALHQPVFAAFHGFFDGIYSTFWADGYLSGNAGFELRPHWNYQFQAVSAGLSIIPCFAMMAGGFHCLWNVNKKERWPFTFLTLAIVIYFAALLHLHLSLPIYSTAKASYTMGLTPAYSVMAAAGAAFLVPKRYVGPIFVSLLFSWAVMTCLCFFVVS